MTQPGLADWLARLESFSPHEIDLGLERVNEVLDRLQIKLPPRILTIAGTNGKGSSVAMAASLLTAAGLRVGAYTSPHIIRYNERICINGKAASDSAIVAAFERVEALRNETQLTYFEYGTIAALIVFEAAGIDVAVLEVGMGGRLDAVNAVDSTACLITNVALDHCDWLGHDIEAIAFEKAGVMREGRSAIFASPEVPATILSHAKDIGADLRVAARDYTWSAADGNWHWRGRTIELDELVFPALAGPLQLQNAAGVLALLECVDILDELPRDAINRSLQSVELSGRMQSVRGERNWLFDVAHNPAAAAALSMALQQSPVKGKTVAIIGMLDDKDTEGLVRPLCDTVCYWIAVRAASPRAIAVDELARRIANASGRACLEADSVESAIEFAVAITDATDRILVTGSFYVVGPLQQALGLYSRR